MNGDKMMQPTNGQNLPTVEKQVAGILLEVKQLMQGMAAALAATNARMEKMERQIEQLTPITGAQERALGEKIKRRAEELCDSYRLSPGCVPLIANAIRKDIKVSGGVRAIRELPRVEYPVYVNRIVLWDDYGVMRTIKKKDRGFIQSK